MKDVKPYLKKVFKLLCFIFYTVWGLCSTLIPSIYALKDIDKLYSYAGLGSGKPAIIFYIIIFLLMGVSPLYIIYIVATFLAKRITCVRNFMINYNMDILYLLHLIITVPFNLITVLVALFSTMCVLNLSILLASVIYLILCFTDYLEADNYK